MTDPANPHGYVGGWVLYATRCGHPIAYSGETETECRFFWHHFDHGPMTGPSVARSDTALPVWPPAPTWTRYAGATHARSAASTPTRPAPSTTTRSRDPRRFPMVETAADLRILALSHPWETLSPEWDKTRCPGDGTRVATFRQPRGRAASRPGAGRALIPQRPIRQRNPFGNSADEFGMKLIAVAADYTTGLRSERGRQSSTR